MLAIAYNRNFRKNVSRRIGLATNVKEVQHFFSPSIGPTYFLNHHISDLIIYKRNKRNCVYSDVSSNYKDDHYV